MADIIENKGTITEFHATRGVEQLGTTPNVLDVAPSRKFHTETDHRLFSERDLDVSELARYL